MFSDYYAPDYPNLETLLKAAVLHAGGKLVLDNSDLYKASLTTTSMYIFEGTGPGSVTIRVILPETRVLDLARVIKSLDEVPTPDQLKQALDLVLKGKV